MLVLCCCFICELALHCKRDLIFVLSFYLGHWFYGDVEWNGENESSVELTGDLAIFQVVCPSEEKHTHCMD